MCVSDRSFFSQFFVLFQKVCLPFSLSFLLFINYYLFKLHRVVERSHFIALIVSAVHTVCLLQHVGKRSGISSKCRRLVSLICSSSVLAAAID